METDATSKAAPDWVRVQNGLVRANALARTDNWLRGNYSANTGALSVVCWPRLVGAALPAWYISPSKAQKTLIVQLFFKNPCFIRLPHLLGRPFFRIGEWADAAPFAVEADLLNPIVVVMDLAHGESGCVVCEDVLFLHGDG